MATSTVEDYLKCILLEEQVNPASLVTMGQIATALEAARHAHEADQRIATHNAAPLPD